jgi:protein kinase C substrate 80K-H
MESELILNTLLLLGKDKEFYSFYDQCFETKEGKYVYYHPIFFVCPFCFYCFLLFDSNLWTGIVMDRYTYKVCAYKKASQAEGHSSTNLGYASRSSFFAEIS